MQKWLVGFALAVFGIGLSGAAYAQTNPSAQAEALLGVWKVTVEGETRQRTLALKGTPRSEGQAVAVDGLYGWSDSSGPVKIAASVTETAAGVEVQFTGTGGSKIRVRQVSANELNGTIVTDKKTAKLVLLRASVKVSDAFPPPGKLTVIYVSSTN